MTRIKVSKAGTLFQSEIMKDQTIYNGIWRQTRSGQRYRVFKCQNHLLSNFREYDVQIPRELKVKDWNVIWIGCYPRTQCEWYLNQLWNQEIYSQELRIITERDLQLTSLTASVKDNWSWGAFRSSSTSFGPLIITSHRFRLGTLKVDILCFSTCHLWFKNGAKWRRPSRILLGAYAIRWTEIGWHQYRNRKVLWAQQSELNQAEIVDIIYYSRISQYASESNSLVLQQNWTYIRLGRPSHFHHQHK